MFSWEGEDFSYVRLLKPLPAYNIELEKDCSFSVEFSLLSGLCVDLSTNNLRRSSVREAVAAPSGRLCLVQPGWDHKVFDIVT